MNRERVRKWAAAYFAFQGVAGCIWWIFVWRHTASRQLWFPDSFDPWLLFPADISLYAIFSLVLATGWWLDVRWAYHGLLVHLGATFYATALAWAFVWRSEESLLGAILMSISSIALVGIAVNWTKLK